MKVIPTFLLQSLATGSLWIASLLPLVLLAFRGAKPMAANRLAVAAAVIYLDLACVMAPRAAWFRGFSWNWQGKILEVLWVLLLASVPGYSLARFGIRGRLAPRSVGPILCVALGAVALPMVFWFQGMRMPPDRETLLFELTMPGFAEELVFRGVFQSLLNEAFGQPWRLGRAPLGWGTVLTAILFVVGHGALFDHHLHLQTSMFAMLFALPPAALLGWLRERTGSVWPGMVVHNLVDGLPLLASRLL
jgi:membrane protease YdiL (CAAX protease family)